MLEVPVGNSARDATAVSSYSDRADEVVKALDDWEKKNLNVQDNENEGERKSNFDDIEAASGVGGGL